MSGFIRLTPSEEEKFNELRVWASKNLYYKFEDDTLNAVHCKCVEWQKCQHIRETFRRFKMSRDDYCDELRNKIIETHMDNILLTAMDDSVSEKDMKKYIRNKSRELADNIETFKWIKRNISQWEMSQISLKMFGTSTPDDNERIKLFQYMKTTAWLYKGKNRPTY